MNDKQYVCQEYIPTDIDNGKTKYYQIRVHNHKKITSYGFFNEVYDNIIKNMLVSHLNSPIFEIGDLLDIGVPYAKYRLEEERGYAVIEYFRIPREYEYKYYYPESECPPSEIIRNSNPDAKLEIILSRIATKMTFRFHLKDKTINYLDKEYISNGIKTGELHKIILNKKEISIFIKGEKDAIKTKFIVKLRDEESEETKRIVAIINRLSSDDYYYDRYDVDYLVSVLRDRLPKRNIITNASEPMLQYIDNMDGEYFWIEL